MGVKRKLLLCAAKAMVAATLCVGAQAQPPAGDSTEDAVYSYRVHGKVRLLFFWVGRDDVGGGTIAVNRTLNPQLPGWTEQVEVLFGSNPDRVPGGINRWGFGRELAEWMGAPGGGSGELMSTLFEGFMRHSKEETLAEIHASDRAEKSGSQFWYDGIRSQVLPLGATSEIRTFATNRDFDYRDSSPIHCSYRQRLQAGPPDRIRKLEKLPAAFRQPLGFLTAVHVMILRLIQGASPRGEISASPLPSIHYVYNAKAFRLDLRKVKIEDKFELPTKDSRSGKSGSQVFNHVARVELNIRELLGEYDHDFTLWVPLQAPIGESRCG
jgi:hypothetical protein